MIVIIGIIVAVMCCCSFMSLNTVLLMIIYNASLPENIRKFLDPVIPDELNPDPNQKIKDAMELLRDLSLNII